MTFWLVVLPVVAAVVAAVAALSWWTSGLTAKDQINRGWATNQAILNRDNGQSGIM